MKAAWERPRAVLVLEDGTIFRGYAFAGAGKAKGEVVFNTGMTGYQEVLTDPSYKGQIVTMTYPLTGTYGVNPEDPESAGIHVEGFIVREYQDFASNWRSDRSLADFLNAHGKIGLEGVDTRAITRHIRVAGAMRGIIAVEPKETEAQLLEEIRAFPGLSGIDMVRYVACRKPYRFIGGAPRPEAAFSPEKPGFRVAVLDCGVKYNILRSLERRGCQVLVFPGNAPASDILAHKPDGFLVSNGPGDPEAVTYAIETTRRLLGEKPLFGICLGHQLLGLALGGRTFKLKFGHRGANQPVQDLDSGKVEITSQNHGFCVDPESIKHLPLTFTHMNLNDRTLEGMVHPDLRAFSIQYHPEASPGPHDAAYHFDRFVRLMREEAPHRKD